MGGSGIRYHLFQQWDTCLSPRCVPPYILQGPSPGNGTPLIERQDLPRGSEGHSGTVWCAVRRMEFLGLYRVPKGLDLDEMSAGHFAYRTICLQAHLLLLRSSFQGHPSPLKASHLLILKMRLFWLGTTCLRKALMRAILTESGLNLLENLKARL